MIVHDSHNVFHFDFFGDIDFVTNEHNNATK